MTKIKMLAPFKNWKVGQVVTDVTPEQVDWLVSRNYAVVVKADPDLPPLQDEPAKKPLTTRARSSRKK